MRTLVIINDLPHGTERLCNRLRLAETEEPGGKVLVF